MIKMRTFLCTCVFRFSIGRFYIAFNFPLVFNTVIKCLLIIFLNNAILWSQGRFGYNLQQNVRFGNNFANEGGLLICSLAQSLPSQNFSAQLYDHNSYKTL